MEPPDFNAPARDAVHAADALHDARVGRHRGSLPPGQRLLVVYHYFEDPDTCPADEEVQLLRTNLLFFLRAAVRPDDGAHYIINLGGRVDETLVSLIPAFANLRIRLVDTNTQHSDTCTFHRTLLEQGPDMFDVYTHFAIINNGMRGPFVAAGDPTAKQHWASPFIELLSDDVKLAGNSLSCERGVHLQGPFLLTDRVGVQLMLEVLGSDTCWGSHEADINFGEVGLSRAVLQAGYNIASTQPEYAGLDFRKVSWEWFTCKGKRNPTFCCAPPDVFRQRWVKHGGTVWRLGLLPAPWLRTVEYYTNVTLSHLPPLHQTHHWQHALATAQEKRLARLQQAEGDISWLKMARAFRSVFAGSQSSRRGDQLPHRSQQNGLEK